MLRNNGPHPALFTALLLACTFLAPELRAAAMDFVRVNQVGYLSADAKIAVAFSNSSLSGLTFSILRVSDNAVMFPATAFPASAGAYSPFANTYKLNFSAFQPAGTDIYKIHLSDGVESPSFKISPCTYAGTVDTALNFYLAQRCGTDNKYAGANCHMQPGGGTGRMDGKVVGGPHAGTLIDAEGAWHDSGDFIKFTLTVAWSCQSLLLAYRENPGAFGDNLDAHGKPGPNGLPDVLDEAKFACDWLIKMNPDANTLYYQVGDGLDHNLGLGTLPQNDNTNYPGTSPYRPVYDNAVGKGANHCGKAAACLAMAYQIWQARGDTVYAATCLAHATQIYALGKARPAVQPATDGFYTENDWRDDMEWAAAEMYRATGTASYLTDGIAWATAIQDAGGELDWAAGNFLAHYSLYPLVPAATQANLKTYMAADLAANLTTAAANPYGMCTTYTWGSMEVLTGGILKAQLYKKLFGGTTYDAMATSSRDFLFGNNPWGVSFVVGLGTTYPHHPQHNIAVGKGIDIPGMPIEGPDTLSDYNSQGISLQGGQDAYGAFDATTANGGVYHDDEQDYATNEPTTTHSGLLIGVLAQLSTACSVGSPTSTPSPTSTRTASPASTPSFTSTSSPTRTASYSPSGTASFSPTRTMSSTPSITATTSPTRSASPSASITASFSATDTSSPSPSMTGSSTTTRTASPSPTSSSTPTLSPSRTGSPSASASVTSGLSGTSTTSPTVTVTSSPSSSASASATRSAIATTSVTTSSSPTSTLGSPSPSVTCTQTQTPGLSSPTSSVTASASMTPSSSATPSVAQSATPSVSSTPSATTSGTAMLSPTVTPSFTQTVTSLLTASFSASASGTATPSQTQTPVLFGTASSTITPMGTSTNTPIETSVPVVAATTVAGDGPLVIDTVLPAPNPDPEQLCIKLAGSADTVLLQVYSSAMTLVAKASTGPRSAGWVSLPLPEALDPSVASGLYYYSVCAKRAGTLSRSVKGVFFKLR